MQTLQVTHSLFSPESLSNWLQDAYSLPKSVQCKLLHVGDSDIYQVKNGRNTYALRVYHQDNYWLASKEAYLFELEWLAYLKEKRCAVAYPILSKEDEYLSTFDAPEGPRYAVLFSFAKGSRGPITRKRAFALGKAIAKIHLTSNKFNSRHERRSVGLDFLISEPISAIKEHLGEEWLVEKERLDELGNALKERISDLLARNSQAKGVIIGDTHGFNQHFNQDEPTLFDFDLCGYGWRAYDLAVFRWLQLSDMTQGQTAFHAVINGNLFRWKSFLSGYQSIRKLTKEELEAIPLLVQARQIWLMGSYVLSPKPTVRLNDDWWGQSFKRLFKKFQ